MEYAGKIHSFKGKKVPFPDCLLVGYFDSFCAWVSTTHSIRIMHNCVCLYVLWQKFSLKSPDVAIAIGLRMENTTPRPKDIALRATMVTKRIWMNDNIWLDVAMVRPHNILDVTWKLWPLCLLFSEKRAIELASGAHNYDFQCELPAELPTSLEAHGGSIRYKVRVVIKVPLRPCIEFEEIFTVIKPLNLNSLATYRVKIFAASVHSSKTRLWFCDDFSSLRCRSRRRCTNDSSLVACSFASFRHRWMWWCACQRVATFPAKPLLLMSMWITRAMNMVNLPCI